MGKKSLLAKGKKQKFNRREPPPHIPPMTRLPMLQAAYSSGLTPEGGYQQTHPFLPTILEDPTASPVDPADLDHEILRLRDEAIDQREAKMQKELDDSAALSHPPIDPLYSAPPRPRTSVFERTRSVKAKAKTSAAKTPDIVKPKIDPQGYPRISKKP